MNRNAELARRNLGTVFKLEDPHVVQLVDDDPGLWDGGTASLPRTSALTVSMVLLSASSMLRANTSGVAWLSWGCMHSGIMVRSTDCSGASMSLLMQSKPMALCSPLRITVVIERRVLPVAHLVM